MRNLQSLGLDSTNVTDKSRNMLLKLRALKRLNIYLTVISAANSRILRPPCPAATSFGRKICQTKPEANLMTQLRWIAIGLLARVYALRRPPFTQEAWIGGIGGSSQKDSGGRITEVDLTGTWVTHDI